MIHVEYIAVCSHCEEVKVEAHGRFIPGERPPAIEMPEGWNGVDTGKLLCPACSGKEPAQH